MIAHRSVGCVRGQCSLFLRQPTERRSGVSHRQWCVRVPARIAGHECVATSGFGGRRTHGILEVRPRQPERPSHDILVDRSYIEDANQTCDPVAGKRSTASFLEEIEDRRHSVCGNDSAAAPSLNGGPKRRRGVRAGTIEDHIQNDVEIEEKRLQRYLRTMCLR